MYIFVFCFAYVTVVQNISRLFLMLHACRIMYFQDNTVNKHSHVSSHEWSRKTKQQPPIAIAKSQRGKAASNGHCCISHQNRCYFQLFRFPRLFCWPYDRARAAAGARAGGRRRLGGSGALVADETATVLTPKSCHEKGATFQLLTIPARIYNNARNTPQTHPRTVAAVT